MTSRRSLLRAGLAAPLAMTTAPSRSWAEAPAARRAAATVVHYRTLQVSDTAVFYREAGPAHAPAVLLLHGFPTSSHMFRNLIPALAERYRVIAPDLPGFGSTMAPPRGQYAYTFDNLARTIGNFTDAVGLSRYALYVFDYGAPVGFRLAVARPERISAIITQNGNAYEEGLLPAWDPLRAYWRDPTPARRESLRAGLTLDATKDGYFSGVADPSLIAPETWAHDQAIIERPGGADIQLDLFGDYRTNVQSYPQWQAYLRRHRPPLLVAWGRHDPFFGPAGAQAYRRDVPKADIHLLDTGHFALETHGTEIAELMQSFLARAVGG